MRRTVFGHNKNNTVLIPYVDSLRAQVMFSTYSGDAVINWGDGSVTNKPSDKLKDYTVSTISLIADYNYSSLYTGDVKVIFNNGLNDIYSWRSSGGAKADNSTNKLNIQDVETFFKQMPSLYSIHINEYAYVTAARQSTIKGDFAKIPNSVERVYIKSLDVLNAATNIYLNISNFNINSKLKYFRVAEGSGGTHKLKILGDLSKLPKDCNHFYVGESATGSTITYTSGRAWVSSFDSLYLNSTLTVSEIDSLLIDLDNSVTTAIGLKIIRLKGTRTVLSDTAVSSLTTKGFTITLVP